MTTTRKAAAYNSARMENGTGRCRAVVDGKTVDPRLIRVWIGGAGQPRPADLELDAEVLKRSFAESGISASSGLQAVIRDKLTRSIDATTKWLLQIAQKTVRDSIPPKKRFGIFTVKVLDPQPKWAWTSVKSVTDRGDTITINGTVVPISGR
jgi:hypothetical protein